MKLARDEWAQVLGLLDQALDLSEVERAPWLAALTTPDERTKRALLDLLAQHKRVETQDFMAHGAQVSLDPGSTTADTASWQPGTAVGPWQLLRELGRGGMASVWLAQRSDGAHQRQVALKLPEISSIGGSPRARVIAERFVRERRILSSLRHPHIAQVLDAGADSGQPWLAMEFVQGSSLIAHANALALNVRQRLALFVPVLQAVQHAHAQLVIHRDIKPANVMVDDKGSPKLLDFGVAKLLEADGDTAETALTQMGGRALTPQYASPEQITGAPLGTASDVYSLGVLLYELLTGELPYQLKRGTAAALEEAILTAQVRRPSQLLNSHGKAIDAKALRGDVDTIVMKALQVQPQHRYASAEAFAQDIERHLTHQPVTAQPDSLGYRLHKLWQRQRLAVIAGTAVVMALGVGLGLALWQSQQRAQQVLLAKENLQDSESAINFMSMVLTEGIKGDESVRLDELLRRSEEMARVSAKADPTTYLIAAGNLAAVHSSLGQYAQADALITRALDTVPAGAQPDKTANLRCMRASQQAGQGQTAIARAALDAEIAALPKLNRTAGWYCYSRRAILRRNLNDAAGGLADSTQALALFEAYGPASPSTRAVLKGEQAYAWGLLGEHAKAHQAFGDAISALGSVGRDDSAAAATLQNNWGVALIGAGRPREALEKFERSMTIGRIRAPDQQPPLYALLNRANAMRSSGDYTAAIVAYRAGTEIARQNKQQPSLATGLSGVVGCAALAGRLSEFNPEIDEMTALLDSGRVAADSPQGLNLRIAKALLLQSQARWQDADKELAAVQARRAELGLKGAADVYLLVVRSDSARESGQHAQALLLAQQAVDLAAKSRGGFETSVNGGLAWLALAEGQKVADSQSPMAKESAQKALLELQSSAAPQHPKLVRAKQLAQSD